MIFIHEIDIKEKQYKEIITLNPYLALREALETAHDDNRFVLIRSTGSYYDILKKVNRDLCRQFEMIKNGEEQSIVIARASIDGDLRDFCNELYSDEWGCWSTRCDYDRECARGHTVIVWFRQKPTGQKHIFCYDVFEDRLDPIIRKIQGANKHVGRTGKLLDNKITQKAENDQTIW